MPETCAHWRGPFKQLRLLYAPDPRNLSGTSLLSGFQTSRGVLKCTE